MEDKDKNPLDNSETFGGMNANPPQNQNTPQAPTDANVNQNLGTQTPPPITPNTSPTTPTPISIPGSPTPSSSQKPSGGKGTTMIVGGILLLFIVIVLVLYWLILRQPNEPQAQQTLAPTPIQQQNLTTEPTPVNEEEQEIVDIELEEDLDEEFAPIEEDVNLL